MKKLRLDVDMLRVDSFVMEAGAARVGTIAARSVPLDQDDGSIFFCGGGGGGYTEGTCIGPTYCCAPTWRPTCAASCNSTCHQYSCVDPEACIP